MTRPATLAHMRARIDADLADDDPQVRDAACVMEMEYFRLVRRPIAPWLADVQKCLGWSLLLSGCAILLHQAALWVGVL